MVQRQRLAIPFLLVAVLASPRLLAAQWAQEAVDLATVQRIRDEGLQRSQIEPLARYLTEVIGPRLTGSPGMREANEWTAQKFRDWGLQNVEIEPWGEFGRGWQQEDYEGRILTPFEQPLHGQPLAWSGSTDGLVRGPAVVARVDDLSDLTRLEGTLAGAFLLVDASEEVEPEFVHRDRRTSLDDLFHPPPDERGRYTTLSPQEREAYRARRRAERELQAALAAEARSQGALAILRISSRGDGVVAGSYGGRQDDTVESLPQVALSREQYNEIYRNVEDGVPVELELMVENRFLDDDLQAYNTLAELPGTDLADQYVMIGAHLDSWHMGSGATDNAAGSVVMMEVMRILKTLDVHPRRTIRIALWSGEEQGLMGSEAWVAKHPELNPRISAYLNVDNGTGRVRGIWDQSNAAAIPVFEQLLWPFRDLGVQVVRHGDTGGTDHLSFDAAGIPGFNFIQDPIEYDINTHHTELDTFDHLVLDDLKQAAVVVAATAYHLAMRDEMMPRKAQPSVSDGGR